MVMLPRWRAQSKDWEVRFSAVPWGDVEKARKDGKRDWKAGRMEAAASFPISTLNPRRTTTVSREDFYGGDMDLCGTY
jgi:hypothetical protein